MSYTLRYVSLTDLRRLWTEVWVPITKKPTVVTYSHIPFANFTSINLVSIFRCSSSTTNR